MEVCLGRWIMNEFDKLKENEVEGKKERKQERIYIYIYREREREREKDSSRDVPFDAHLQCTCIYFFYELNSIG